MSYFIYKCLFMLRCHTIPPVVQLVWALTQLPVTNCFGTLGY